MVCPKKWASFLGSKFWFLVQKSVFCHTTPILVNDPFLALGMTVNFRSWERFFDFPFRSYSCFHKKILLTAKKVFPFPTVGAPSASNSPSALSAQALRDMDNNSNQPAGHYLYEALLPTQRLTGGNHGSQQHAHWRQWLTMPTMPWHYALPCSTDDSGSRRIVVWWPSSPLLPPRD